MPAVNKNMHWLIGLLLPAIFLFQLQLLHHFLHIDLSISAEESVTSTILLGLSTWGILLVLRAYPTTAAIYVYALAVAVLISFVVTYVDSSLLKIWIGTGNLRYLAWLKNTIPLRFLLVLLFHCWMATNAAMYRIIRISEERSQLQQDASRLHREAELFKLRQQLQPHFLYNSLNSINALVLADPEKAQEMTGKLAAFLRSSVRRESEEFITLNEELEYLQSYLDIESVRFGDRLTVEIGNDVNGQMKIPSFLLQPILENAVKFGLYGKTGLVKIRLTIQQKEDLVWVIISNPYDPDTQPPRGTGFGLDGVKRRLWLLYGRSDLLETSKTEDEFTTMLKIPIENV